MKLFLVAFLLPFLVLSKRLTEEENAKLQKECGLPPARPGITRRSIHTPEISRAQAPWVVRLELTREWLPHMTIEDRKNKTSSFCSGSLISSRHLLTAAHCIADEDAIKADDCENGVATRMIYKRNNIDRITVKILETLPSSGGGFKEIHVPIKKAFISKKYRTWECPGSKIFGGGDVGVIELEEEVKFSDKVYPACLNDQDLPDGSPLQMAGYGKGPNTTHKDYDLDELRLLESKLHVCGDPVAPDVRCTINGMGAACGGDSGAGHFYRDDKGKARIVAPLSGGLPCSTIMKIQMDQPFIPWDKNTLVKPHLLWICAATGICLDEEAITYYKLYEAKGLASFWYTTYEKLSGYEIFV